MRGFLSLSDADKLREIERLIRLRCADCTPTDLRRKRQAAGISQGMAAHIAGITWLRLDMIERGISTLDDDAAELLDRLYGTDTQFRLIMAPAPETAPREPGTQANDSGERDE